MIGAAVAAFVKTPGLSPVKTRLAATIGKEAAEEFYDLSWRSVEAVLAELVEEPYWAVAESAACLNWRSFPCIWQGEGGLAERLDQVYAALLYKHKTVYLVGADCPQLSAEDFAEARSELAAGADFAIGPARDGGFYLLAGAKPIPRASWLAVPMSTPETGARLISELEALGTVATIRERCDVDTAADLAPARDELRALAAPVPAQRALLDWLSNYL